VHLSARAAAFPAKWYGFVFHDGNFTLLDGFTEAWDINKSGQVVGRMNGTSYLYSNGTYTEIRAPGADGTMAYGLNDAGTVVGQARFGFETRAFVFDGNSYFFLDLGESTRALDIANDGTVVGSVGGSGFVFREGVATTYTHPTLPDVLSNQESCPGYQPFLEPGLGAGIWFLCG